MLSINGLEYLSGRATDCINILALLSGVLYWDRYYSVQVLRITTLRLNIGSCSSAVLFSTDWYSSARRILDIAPYVHTYKPALYVVSYDKHTNIHTQNILYGTHENLPKSSQHAHNPGVEINKSWIHFKLAKKSALSLSLSSKVTQDATLYLL